MKLTPAECVFEALGGVRETARVLSISPGSVSRWMQGLQPGDAKAYRRSGAVPRHHMRALMAEAQARGKRLTLEDLVFGRDAATQGVVIVRDGVKVQIKTHDIWQTMTNTLVGAV